MEAYDILIDVTDEVADGLTEQPNGEVDVEAVRAAVAATLEHLAVPGASVTVVLTTDAEVRELNAQYRGIDSATDVLSFAARESQDGAPALVLPDAIAAEVDAYLGDIVIAYPYSARQAAHFGNSVTAELQLLAVHGMLHLLGYDHQDTESESAMWALQETILARFGHASLARRAYDEPA